MTNAKALRELNNTIFDSYMDNFIKIDNHANDLVCKNDLATTLKLMNQDIGFDNLVNLPAVKAYDYVGTFLNENKEKLSLETNELLANGGKPFVDELFKTLFVINPEIGNIKALDSNVNDAIRKTAIRLSFTDFFLENDSEETKTFIYDVCTSMCDNNRDFVDGYLEDDDEGNLSLFMNLVLMDKDEVELYDKYTECEKGYRYDIEHLIRVINNEMGLRNFYRLSYKEEEKFIASYLEDYGYADYHFEYDDEIECTRLDLNEFASSISSEMDVVFELYYTICLKNMVIADLNIDKIAEDCVSY